MYAHTVWADIQHTIYCSSHLGPRPTSLTRLTDSKCEEIYLWMTPPPPPPACLLLYHPHWELPGQLSPPLTVHNPGPLSHPSPWWRTGKVRQSGKVRSMVLHPLLWPCALPLLIVPPRPSVTSINSNAIYSLAPRHVLLQRLSCCTWPALQKVLLRVKISVWTSSTGYIYFSHTTWLLRYSLSD